MVLKRVTIVVVLCLAFLALGLWQHHEYVQECDVAAEMLRRQSHSIMNALIGGIKTHRRRGRFFVEQLQGSLDGLVVSPDVVAVSFTDNNCEELCLAGKAKHLLPTSPKAVGEHWDGNGFWLVESMELRAAEGGFGGGGQGRGWGTIARAAQQGDVDSPFSKDGQYFATLVLDRAQYDDQCERAKRLRITVAGTGGLLTLAIVLAWIVTVRVAGRAKLLETETRHLRDLSQAAAGLAHETRNPLSLIRGWAQRLVQTGFESQEQQEQAESIVEECDRVTARINQFLAFARPPQPNLQSVTLSELLNELSVVMKLDLDARGVTLNCSQVSDQETVLADRELLRQAMFNLIQNAIQASPEGEAVDVTVGAGRDGKRRIEVSNRGPTVSADSVGRLFTPYFTTREDGTGLGLAIVRHIAISHGWKAGYSARPGGGSEFWLDGMHG